MYDSDGTILGIGYKKGSDPEKNYFFEKNAFVDVIAVYRNSDSVLIGTYEYDLWGNPVSAKEAAGGRDTDGILQKNPFRYRCYYYDTETGFYYLNSRYYDPQIRRFISADSMVTNTGTDVLGYNLYSYCNNSPLNKTDSDGHFPKLSEIFTGIAIVPFIVAAGILIAGTGGLGGGALALVGGGMLGSGAAAATNVAMVGVGATCAASAAGMMESSGNNGYNKQREKNDNTSVSNQQKNKIPDNDSVSKHIFRDAKGHISDIPGNRALLEDVANNSNNFRGIDKYGNEWYTKVLENGKQVWVQVRNGNIFEGGINEVPKLWDPSTG